MTGIETELSAWENEGGALASNDHRQQVESGSGEQQILRRLGSGVVAEWKNLPTEIQRRLFNHATAAASCDPAGGKEQIARFLHTIIDKRNGAGGSKQA